MPLKEIANAKRAVATAMRELGKSGLFSKGQTKALHAVFNQFLISLSALDDGKVDRQS
jgi:hypothetical protein